MNLKGKDFLKLLDFSPAEIEGLIDLAADLKPEMFSSDLLGRAFGQLMQRHQQGLEVSATGLSEFTAEEMSHLASVFQGQQGPVNEQAFRDCVATVRREHQSGKVETDEDFRSLMEHMKKSKGFKA